jgi:AsmA protein
MAITSRNRIERKPFYTRLIRFLLYSLLGFIIFLILATSVFYIYKDTIGKELLLSLNSKQKGEITFSDISFNPFVQFPSVSIQLNDFSYFEQSKDSINTNFKVSVDKLSPQKLPIAQFQYLYAAISITDLLRRRINISKVLLKNGQVNIVKYPDSTLNFLNAIRSVRTDTVDIKQDSAELDLSLERILLRNIQVIYNDSVNGTKKSVILNSVNASLKYQQDVIISDIEADLQLVEFPVTNKILLTEKSFYIGTSIVYERSNDIIKIGESRFKFEKAEFDFDGIIDLKDKGFINLNLEGSDQGFSFFQLVLTETGIDNVHGGNIYFNGTIKGAISNGIPEFDFSFGLKNVDLFIPSVESYIENMHFEGKFNSGTSSNFSQAGLQIDNLSAEMPGGYIKGNCEVKNFVSPYFKLDWDMKANITGFDEIFKLDFLDSLSGNIEIYDHVIARFDPDLGIMVEEINDSRIICDNLKFKISDVMNIQNISGTFIRAMDTLRLDSVFVLTGNTDLLINGEIYNIHTLLFNDNEKITADLSIQSSVFDLPELFAYDPRVGRNFPYQIIDINLLVHASTTTSKLLEFYSNPEIDFEIKHLDAIIRNFLPRVSISKGFFKLHEKDQRVLLNFTDFEISMAESKIYADVEYYSPPILSDYVKTKVNLENLSPGKVFYYDSSDTIPNILNGFINGSLICDVTLSSDTNILDKVFIDQGNLVYETAKDTFRIKSLYLDAENIIYDLDLKSNPLATLTANCIIKANEINTGILKVNDVRYDIDVNKGEFTISPKQISFFGEEGHGTYILKPFAEIPTYELMYSVRQFEISQLLSSFLEDTIITGTANFKMDITMSGDHWDSVVSNINGDLYVSGTELTMYGLDADKLIEKLKRSQNFNLVDVGAVILAGPVGLAVTKGSDFARIIVANPGEQTFIPNFSSAWKVKNGRLIIEDVAFTTDNNRIAALGWIDLNTDSLNLTIAALNNKGCVIISQDLYGKLEEPEMSDVKVVKSLLAPVTNLVGGALGIDCKVFYEGEIEHPVKKRK